MVLSLERYIRKEMENNFIKTNKYKTINLYLYYTCPYDLKRRLCFNLLSYFIGDYSNKYQTKEAMTSIKDNLYGANVYCSAKVKANLLTFNIKYSFINPKFFDDIKEEDFIKFFKEFLYNVYFSDELLEEFKLIYKDTILRSLDKPNNYANNRINQIIGSLDKNFLVYDIDHINDVDAITLDDVKETYTYLLNDCGVNTYLIGDYSNEFLSYVKTLDRGNPYRLENNKIVIEEIEDIVENKNVSQSSLQVVFKSPYSRNDKEFYAYMLGNAVFGIVPTSLLFDEVREKLSLCYYISVYDYLNEGIVKVYTAIEGKNKDTVLEQINIQLQRMINMDYDPNKIELAKSLIIDSIVSLKDNVDAYCDYLYSNEINGITCLKEEYIDNLNKVTIDDISNVFKQYKHVLTYMLNGVKNEKDS